ncbi:Ig-like domain-containing protein, partial [Patiriisocius marinistellae]|uniref:Ig-like domain-containing protein n=1 Tax=Patiriisocius marinistellae TaxID=2494560 RepID=UPI00156260C1
MKNFTQLLNRNICLSLFLIFLFSISSYSQTISATNGRGICGNCAPPGWVDAGGSPDVSDRNNCSTAAAGGGGGDTWLSGPLPLPPNGHETWLSLRDLGDLAGEETVRTTMEELIVGDTYEITVYTLTALGNGNGAVFNGNNIAYAANFNDSYRYLVEGQAITSIAISGQNTWQTDKIVFTATATDLDFTFFPGNNAGGGNNTTIDEIETVQLSVTLNSIENITDSDGDGVPDTADVCPGFDDTADNDNDLVPDGCDLDDDNDGILDTVECPNISLSSDIIINSLSSGNLTVVGGGASGTPLVQDAGPGSDEPGLRYLDQDLGLTWYRLNLNGDDYSSVDGNFLNFRIYIEDQGQSWFNNLQAINNDIRLVSGGTTLISDVNQDPFLTTEAIGDFPVSYQLTAANFGVSQTAFEAVISNLDFIDIRAEFWGGNQGILESELVPFLTNPDLACDIDMDGIPNIFDEDSDGDGCNDADEAYNNSDTDFDNNGFFGNGTPAVDPVDGTVVAASYVAPTATGAGLNTFEEGMNVVIATTPEDEDICETEIAQFDAVANATPVATNTPVATASTNVTYQWSVSTDGINFSDLASETGTVASGATVSLVLTGVTEAMDGNIYKVLFTNEANICGAEAEATLTVNVEDAGFNYDAAAYCVDASDPTPTIIGDAGGTFSSAPAGLTINASTGQIDVSASTPNTYSVTYTTSGVCPASSNVSVTINALDDASFSYDAAAYCVDDSDPTPTITGLAGGTFTSGAGLSITSSTGAIDVSASTPGTYAVTYTTIGTCPNSSTASITINALDDASFSYDAAAYCEDATDPTPTITGVEGGTFSSTTGLSINATTGAIDVSASTPGTYSVIYTTAGTCPNSSTASITINALDDASFSYDAAAYCVDDSDPTPTITGLAGGTFTSGAGLSITSSTGAIDVSASTPGTYSITYTTTGTCPNSSIASVTINALDDASFSYDAAAYCTDDSDPTPTITGLAGGTFTSGAGLSITSSTGAIDVSASTPGTYSITYTTTGACPNSSIASVTIKGLPIAVNDDYDVDEDDSVVLTPLNLDSDPDGDTLTIESINGTALTPGTAQTIAVDNGIVTIDAAGVITFTPDANFNGDVVIPYVITDSDCGTATANETISVKEINDAPVAVDDDYTVDEDDSVVLTPLDLDTDLDGDTLTIESINGTALTPGTAQTIAVDNGTVTIDAAGVITFTPDANF